MNKKLLQRLTAGLLLAAVLVSPLAVKHTGLEIEPGLTSMTMRADGDRPAAGSSVTTPGSSYNFKTSSKYPYSQIKSRINTYKETNSDVVGWLTIPNTNINSPIVYSNTSNDYYVYRTWDKKHYPNTNYLNFVTTSTYADYRINWGTSWRNTSRNIVLYGHNWTNLRNPLDIGANNNHTMFGQLPSYTNLEFCRNNPYIYFSTGENEGIWKVFAVAYTELSKNFFYNNPRPSDESYEKLLKEWQQRTMYTFNTDVNTDDRILTLSTCTRWYGVGENQRFVVVARLLRDGESENDAVTVKVNENMKAPQF